MVLLNLSELKVIISSYCGTKNQIRFVLPNRIIFYKAKLIRNIGFFSTKVLKNFLYKINFISCKSLVKSSKFFKIYTNIYLMII